MDVIKAIESEQMKENAENFCVGDTVKVFFKIVEGTNERVQVFEGLVIAKNHGGIRRTFVVRKISYGVGVERIFPLHSPRVERIEVVRRGRVRRAKLYYIRKKVGKKAKVKELIRRKNA
nr:50S ribosomal protein L19 [uncultured Sphaerochaeta sp.]